MDSKTMQLLNRLQLRIVDTGEGRKEKLEQLHDLPADYIEFMTIYDGGDGFFHDNSHLDLWSLDDIIESIQAYQSEPWNNKTAIFIGREAGPTIFGYDIEGRYFFEIDEFLSEDQKQKQGKTFAEFIQARAAIDM